MYTLYTEAKLPLPTISNTWKFFADIVVNKDELIVDY